MQIPNLYTVCFRSCNTVLGEDIVSCVTSWTGGFAERSSETWMFPGLKNYLVNKLQAANIVNTATYAFILDASLVMKCK